MKALSALAKFTGVYDNYRALLKLYGLKWTINTDDAISARTIEVFDFCIFPWS
jgi:hypothetical protein